MSINQSLCEEVIQLLSKKQKTLFTAESCTAGLISAQLADISGASTVLLGGIVAYSNDIKQSVLHIRPETLEKHGAVSFECVKEMAQGAMTLSRADYIIAVTGIAGPLGGSIQKPVGTVYTSILSTNGGWSQQFFLEGSREEIRLQSVELALKLLLATEQEEEFFDLRLRNAQEI